VIRRRDTLASRLYTVVLLSIGVGLVVSTLGSALATYVVLERERENQIGARVLSASRSLGAALSVGGARELNRALDHIADGDHVRAVRVYGPNGSLVLTRPPDLPERGTSRGAEGEMTVAAPVVHDGRVLGQVVVVAGRTGIATQAWFQAAIVAIASIVSLAIAAFLAAILQRSISRPIVELSEAVSRVESEGDFSGKLEVDAVGETGALVNAFNAMLERLAQREAALRQAHTSLVRASREAGMAEVATGILHNVGNVLNSINTSAEVAVEHVQGLSLEPMRKALELATSSGDVGTFLSEDVRGKKVLPYLKKSVEHAFKQRRELMAEMDQIRERLEHVKEIVQRQRAYAGATVALETCSVTELVEDSLALTKNSIQDHHVDVVREFLQNPSLRIDRHWMLQILVNLISNACEALADGAQGDRKLTVQTELDGDRCVIRVSDNGVGIAPEDAAKLFGQGFTTKATGLGFGLHDSSIAVRQMNGTLEAQSEGRGRGATFTLRVPLTPVAKR
jgi:two-component system, NtrC family, sensor kinase